MKFIGVFFLSVSLILMAAIAAYPESAIQTVIQNGHSGDVRCVAFSPDGQYLISASEDKTAKLWRMDGRLLKNIRHQEEVICAAFSPDGSFFATSDGTIRLWGLDGSLLRSFDDTNMWNNQKFAFSPDGRTIVSGSIGENSKLTLCGLDGNIIRVFKEGHDDSITSLAFSPDGKTIASGSWDKTVKIWTVDGTLLKTLKVHTNDVNGVAFSPDGKYLATASDDQRAILWKTSDWSLARTLKNGFDRKPSGFLSVRFSPDGNLVTGDSYGIKLWKITDGSLIRSISNDMVYCLAVSADGRALACGNTASIDIFNTGGLLVRSFKSHSGWVNSVAVSPDGRTIACGGQDDTIRLWNSDYGLDLMINAGFMAGMKTLAFSPDSKTLLSPGSKGSIVSWGLNGQLLKSYEYQTDAVLREIKSLAFSPDGKYFASGSGFDNTVQLWSVDKGLIRTFRGVTNDVINVAFHPDGGVIAASLGDATVRFWDASGNLKKTIGNKDDINVGIAFSPDGSLLATVGNGIQLWDGDGKLVRTIEALFPGGIAFSPDGKRIAVGSFNFKAQLVQLWSVEGELIREFAGHSDRMTGLAFTPDGKFIVSSSWDSTVKVWNAETGDCVSLLSFDTGDWFVYDEQGHFDCSDGGRNFIGFVSGLDYYEPDQFWDQFYVPGLLGRFLRGEKTETTLASIFGNVPQVSIVGRDEVTETADGSAVIKVKVKGGDNGVGRVFLYHNGRVVDENARGITIKAAGDLREFGITLTEGENTIAAAAFDKDDKIEGRSGKITIYYRPAKIEKPDIYILSIGVSGYKNAAFNLASCRDDAIAFAELLKTSAARLYGNVYPQVITDDGATTAAVLRSFSDLSARARPIDAVIVYLAGHGYALEGKYYYFTYETSETDLPGTALSIDRISEFVRSLSANKIALFLDTCQSGSAALALLNATARGMDERMAIATLAKQRGITVFAASSENQSSYEIKELGHGLFTYSLIDALKNGGGEIRVGDSISLGKLTAVVEKSTRDLAWRYLKREQNPMKYNFGEDFSIGK